MSERRRIYRRARNAHTSRTIAEFFDGLGKRVFIRSELVRLIDKNREQWALVQDASSDEVIDDFIESLPLRRFILVSGNYTNQFQRYAWRDPDPLEVAASIRAPKSYLCTQALSSCTSWWATFRANSASTTSKAINPNHRAD